MSGPRRVSLAWSVIRPAQFAARDAGYVDDIIAYAATHTGPHFIVVVTGGDRVETAALCLPVTPRTVL